jgi:mannose-6-phosphate isomerase
MTRPTAVVLPANQPRDRFYDGGARIAAFRGDPPAPDHTPEDWVGSTTMVRGQEPVGLTVLPSGIRLIDAVESNPIAWLGQSHLDRYGVDAKLLVKLLDAGQRLPVHAHPDTAFAAAHLGTAHGKAEAWYILEPGIVYLGLREAATPGQLLEWAESQDRALLSRLNAIEVAAHDAVFVPAGTLHAIGAGVFLAEVQEPEDLSILLEWSGFAIDGERDGHLGIGFPTAVAAVNRDALAAPELERLVTRGVVSGPVLPDAADAFFRLDRVTGPMTFDAGFAVVIAVAGGLVLEGAEPIALGAGTTLVVPAAHGGLRFTGNGDALVARPPL